MSLAIVGTRENLLSYDEFVQHIRDIDAEFHILDGITEIVSGGCPTGIDQLAEIFAKTNKYKLTVYPSEWSLGKKAGPMRNQLIVNHATCIVAFPKVLPYNTQRTYSAGTNDTINKAQRANKQCYILEIEV